MKYTGKKRNTTDYIYDDVELLNRYQVRLTRKISDVSVRYGVACTYGDKFSITDCVYSKVTFLDGFRAVKAINEDGDEFAIDRWGDIFDIEVYKSRI